MSNINQVASLINVLLAKNEALQVALGMLICPVCDHELQRHIDQHGCEFDRGDAWVTGNQPSAPTVLMAIGPCGCDVDDLKDYPDFARALEALRLASIPIATGEPS